MFLRATTFAVVLSLLISVSPARVDACRAPLEVVFFEGHVGTIIRTPNGKVFVVDANSGAAGQIVPWLHDRGIKEIDALLITHPHGDHYAGVPRLLRTFKVKRLIDNGYLAGSLTANTPDTRMRRVYKNTVVGPAVGRGVKHVTDVKAGHKVALDSDLEVTLLGPRKQGYKSAVTEARLTNKHSIIVYVRHGDVGIMLPGDSPDDTQATIAQDFPKETRETDVMLLPHHGKYYCNPGFAKHVGAANPKARVGVASRDATGPTLAKWRSAGLKLYHTDGQGGDVKIESTGKDFTVTSGKGPQRKEDHFTGK